MDTKIKTLLFIEPQSVRGQGKKAHNSWMIFVQDDARRYASGHPILMGDSSRVQKLDFRNRPGADVDEVPKSS